MSRVIISETILVVSFVVSLLLLFPSDVGSRRCAALRFLDKRYLNLVYSLLDALVSPTASLSRLSLPHRLGPWGAREVDAMTGALAAFGSHHEPRCQRRLSSR